MATHNHFLRNAPIRLFKAARQICPGQPVQEWMERRLYRRAVLAYTKALKLQPQDVGLYCRRVEAWRDLEEFDKSIEDFGHVVRMPQS